MKLMSKIKHSAISLNKLDLLLCEDDLVEKEHPSSKDPEKPVDC